MTERVILDQFVEAFNTRQLDPISSLLQDDAVAQVVEAPFPREEGRETIMKTSIPYMAGGDLAASVVVIDGHSRVIFRTQGGQGPLDVIAHIDLQDKHIQRIDWITGPHCPVELHKAGKALGLETTLVQE